MNQGIVPIESYATVYYNIVLLAVLLLSAKIFLTEKTTSPNKDSRGRTNIASHIFIFFVIAYIGLRPTHEIFVDMITYEAAFINYQYGIYESSSKDPAFHILLMVCSELMGPNSFFLLCSILYVIPLLLVSRNIFGKHWFYAFLFLVGSFSFWGYATNGIRNGLASSFLLLAITQKTLTPQIIWSIIAVGMHKSMLLPTLAFFATSCHNNSKTYFIAWIFCIFLSLIGGSFWVNLFSGLGLNDDRLSYLTTVADTTQFSKTGFRWDFLIYSLSAIAVGIKYLSNNNDPYYSRILNTYLISNSVWILVIQANYSNRFAYLSWFMIGIVFSYPLIKEGIAHGSFKKTTNYLIGYFSFTYLMGVILKT